MKEGKGTNEDAIVCWREIETKRGGEGEREGEREIERNRTTIIIVKTEYLAG